MEVIIMKKLLLLALASFSSVCFGTLVRIGLITQSGETIYMIGDYYDERHNTIKTPFDYINETINVQFMGQEGLMVKEVADQPGLLEYVHQVAMPNADPAILRMVIALLTEPGHDINQLDMPTMIQLITTCETLKISPLILDILLDRIITLSIDDPVHCPFAENSRGLENTPTVFRDSVTIQNRELIAAARKNIAKIFAEEVLPASKWVEEEQFWRGGLVTSIAFSPDSRYLATGLQVSTARVWNMQTREQIGKPFRQNDVVILAVFSPDGKYLATGLFDNTVHIWDVQANKEIAKPLLHSDRVHTIAFSPNGKYIATGSNDCTARIWDAQTHKPIGDALKHDDYVISVAFSPDSKYLTTGSLGYTTHIWDVQTQKEIVEPFILNFCGDLITFSLDGRYIAIGDGLSLRIFDVKTHKQIGKPLKSGNLVTSAAFSPDGKYFATGSWDQTARIWDARTNEQVGEPFRHDDSVDSVAFSPDGKYFATVSGHNTARIWHQEWNWSNWPISYHGEDTDYNGNLLKQLLMIRVAREIPLTPGVRTSLQPIYDQLPASAQEWIDAKNPAWHH